MSNIKVTRDGVTVDGLPVEGVFDISLDFNIPGKPHVTISRFKMDENGQILGDESGPLKVSEDYAIGHLEIIR